MNRAAWLFPCLVSVLLLAFEGQIATAQTAIPDKTLADIKAATVFIKVPGGSGSGFLMDRDKDRGIVVTNAHVAHPNGRTSASIHCIFHSGSKEEFTVTAKMISADDSRDLAILEVKHNNLPKELAAESKSAVRETLPIFVIGYPYGELLETAARRGPAATISRATVSSVRRDQYDNVSVIQVDGGINPGNSGGPVVDSNGALIGIAVAKVVGTQIGFAIPARDLTEMLQGRVGGVSLRAFDDKTGKSNFEMRVELIDPLSKIRSVQVMVFPRSEMKGTARPDEKGLWQPIGNTLKTTTLPAEGGFASGKVTVPADSKPGIDYYFQLRYTRGDRQVRLTAPTPLAERAAPFTSSVARSSSSAPSRPPRQTSDALRPSTRLYTAGLAPPKLAKPLVEKGVPGTISGSLLGGGGRYLVLHLGTTRTAAIFDINDASLIKTIEVAPDALLAATVERLYVVSPFENELEFWTFPEFAESKECTKGNTVKLPFPGSVKNIAAGHASRGPLLFHWTEGAGSSSHARFSFLDADLFRPLRVDGVETKTSRSRPGGLSSSGSDNYFVLRSGSVRDDVCIRAAANGDAYGLWTAGRSSSGLESLLIGDAVVRDYYESDSAGHVVPMADGSAICTAIGYYTADLARKRGSESHLPTTHPDYAIRLAAPGTTSAATTTQEQSNANGFPPAPASSQFPPTPGPFPTPPFGPMQPGARSPFTPPPPPTTSSSSRSRTAKQSLPRQGSLIDERGRDVAQLPEMPEMEGSVTSDGQKGLTLDQRYLCLPQAKLLITIPPANDKLVFHTIDVEVAPYDAIDPREENGGGGAVTTASALTPQPRTWNDKSGKFSVEATFLSFEGGQVKLKKEDGSILAVPLEKLSEADAEYVRGQTKK